MNTTFRFDPELIKNLYNRLQKDYTNMSEARAGKLIDEFPTCSEFEEMITVLFWASILMEEGRISRFRIVYSKTIQKASKGLIFAKPIEFKIEELKKLAPSIVPPEGRLCVFPKNKKLYIYGMQTAPIPDETALLIEIIDPGRLIIQYPPKRKVAEIKGHQTGFIDLVWNTRGNYLLSLGPLSSPENSIFKNIREHLYETMTQEILRRVRQLGSGGALIFVGGEILNEKYIEPLKYKCDIKYDAMRHLEYSIKNHLRNNPLQSDEDFQLKNIVSNSYGTPENKEKMAEAARTIAYLTAVDGATILNEYFQVIGFGAKIIEKKIPKKEFVNIVHPFEDINNDNFIPPYNNNLVPLTTEFRGKRHLSLARFVLHYPNSIGFVISQDGGITGFFKQNGVLVAYRDLELLTWSNKSGTKTLYDKMRV